ncbi:polysaccharide pyruvyl transferase [Luteitalea sp. TBR-22]|uniref:polysaccharide pyruvyl transferase family protein n=1 Tax=Luteitalea sp. TBR-22 TaxID=2802971 RepID=UPI001AF86DA6|nr:polysaccharide pyruvyl transferase family protein [Luteitalea sp. TBR-22]BCS35389.1 polysaccharide pyruvyl transferase [Luteitalea sp. TBR-22]
MNSRRSFLATAAAVIAARPSAWGQARPRRIVLRSSWQTINIGDIAHTPGVLRLLEQHLPGAEVTLWASTLDEPVRELLRRRFPRVRVLELAEHADPAGTPLEPVVREADLLIHGSGPSIVAPAALRLARTLGTPYGVYGVTLDTVDAPLQDLLSGAAFVFTRETSSLEYVRSLALRAPSQAFAPDGTFALDIRDDETAEAFCRRHGLEAGRFLCVVPRLRYTPYPWVTEGAARGEAEPRRRLQVNDQFAAADHAKLREVIVAWVRGGHGKVLACPEMTYQVPLLRPLLFDGLPGDVKKAVVVRDRYWRTDEAASTYARAALVVSCEMHSPIIALANGTPAIHVRQPTDTRKGQMWRDIGLGEWLFEIDQVQGEAIATRALAIAADRTAARAVVERAMGVVHERQRDTMGVVAAAVRKG